MQQPVDRLAAHQQRAGANEQRLAETGQGFGLPVTVAVVIISGSQRVLHGQQIEQRGGAIQQRVGQPRQQADRATLPPGQRLGRRQEQGGRQRGAGGQ